MTPIGSIIYWPSQLMPTGYLLCDGREVAINDYPELYAAIGNIGGDDVASGNFRLPDMRGVVAGGYRSGLPSSNPLHGNFGDQVGNPTKSLSVANLAKHKHDIVYSEPNANITQKGVSISHDASGSLKTLSVESFVWGNQTANKFGGGSNNIFAAYEGSGSPFSIVQPTKLYNWIIKAKHVTQLGGTVSDDFEVKGKLIMPEDKWASSGGAINMRNSDIVNANGIYMNDESEGHEGINFLKQGASPGSTNQDDYENLRGFRGKLYYNENPVVESGSNSNGRWTKWMDGTMICTKYIDFGNVSIETAWGSFYETASPLDCGNFAQQFISTPAVSIMPLNTFFVEKSWNDVTQSSWGKFWACRPATYTDYRVMVSCIAIGRWK